MQLVKVGEQFYQECKKHGTDKELLFNKSGRPCVLIVKLKYKGQNHKFVVPLRSNIAANTPKNQYFALPPNSSTKSGNYLYECEQGKKNPMTPDIDGILSWL